MPQLVKSRIVQDFFSLLDRKETECTLDFGILATAVVHSLSMFLKFAPYTNNEAAERAAKALNISESPRSTAPMAVD